MRGARMLNSVSRSLSDVGRSPSQVGAFSRRPFSDPAMTRISLPDLPAPPDLPGPLALPDLPAPPDLPHLDQLEALLPVNDQFLHGAGRRDRSIEPARSFRMRRRQEIAIADEIDQAKRRHAGLTRAEEISRPAQLEIPV